MSKKHSKQKRRERRLAEIAKAQGYSRDSSLVAVENKTMTASPDKQSSTPVAYSAKLGYHELPLKEIKKDVIKNFAYLIFAVAAIVAIKLSGINFAGMFFRNL